MFQMIDNVARLRDAREYEKMRRQREQELYENSIADRQRSHKTEDANTQITLNNIGAQAANPKLDSLLDQAFGPSEDPRMKVNTTVGDFYLPTVKENQARTLSELIAKAQAGAAGKLYEQTLLKPGEVEKAGQIAGAQETARNAAKPKNKVSPAFAQMMGWGEISEATKEQVDSAIAQYNAAHPNQTFQSWTDNDGTVTAATYNPKTGRLEPVQIPGSVRGKSSSELERSIPSSTMKKYENKAHLDTLAALRQKYPQGIESPEYAAAKDKETFLLTGGKRYIADITKTPEYDEMYRGLLDKSINGYEQNRAKITRNSSSGKQAVPKSQTYPASAIEQDAKDAGMTPERFRQQLKIRNITIDEKN